jgi:hypothetical protein
MHVDKAPLVQQFNRCHDGIQASSWHESGGHGNNTKCKCCQNDLWMRRLARGNESWSNQLKLCTQFTVNVKIHTYSILQQRSAW